MLPIILTVVLLFSPAQCQERKPAIGQKGEWSKRIADTFLARHSGGRTSDSVNTGTKWNYEQGLMLVALSKLWSVTGDERYLEFVRTNIDLYVDSTGTIQTYKMDDLKLDDIGPGRALLSLYAKTGREKYKKAADLLREHLRRQPRTSEGGFWHKKIYPHQLWLDGLFMASPFYARYAKEFGESRDFDDIANQALLMTRHMRDAKTGLFYHGWDESKAERWSNPETGCSPSFWGRAMGWYVMGLVDVLDDLPKDHPKRPALVGILIDLARAITNYQDPKTGLWYQVIDQGSREGNYLESSCSAMFAYAFAKGVRQGYLPEKYRDVAERAFAGLIEHQVKSGSDGMPDLQGTCRAAGLGAKPYRDGTYEYYISETQRTNDLKGLGAWLLAAIELENE